MSFLWWRDCPSWERALADLRAAMGEEKIASSALEIVEIVDEDDAERLSFVGSPTIRVDGHDVDRLPEGARPGLTCRIYRREDGRVSPLPDGEQVREALKASKKAKGDG